MKKVNYSKSSGEVNGVVHLASHPAASMTAVLSETLHVSTCLMEVKITPLVRHQHEDERQTCRTWMCTRAHQAEELVDCQCYAVTNSTCVIVWLEPASVSGGHTGLTVQSNSFQQQKAAPKIDCSMGCLKDIIFPNHTYNLAQNFLRFPKE